MFGVLRSPILGVKNTAAKLSSTKKIRNRAGLACDKRQRTVCWSVVFFFNFAQYCAPSVYRLTTHNFVHAIRSLSNFGSFHRTVCLF